MLNFCSEPTCRRLLSSPEEITKDKCRYCLRGIEASTSAFFSTFRATMTYALPRPKSRKTKAKAERISPPSPVAVAWVDAEPDCKNHMAETCLSKGEIRISYIAVAKFAVEAAKAFKTDIETATLKTVAEVEVHELIHAWGQVGHTTQKRLGYQVATTRVFDKVASLMGHSVWWGIRMMNKGPDIAALNRQVVDLDNLSAGSAMTGATVDKQPTPEEPDMDTNLTPESVSDIYPTTAADWARIYAAKRSQTT